MERERPTRGRGWKRRAAVWVVVCAVLGLVTTVGVAWWGAVKSPREFRWHALDESGEFLEFRNWSSTKLVESRNLIFMPHKWKDRLYLHGVDIDSTPRLVHGKESWGILGTQANKSLSKTERAELAANGRVHHYEFAAGWPLLSLHYQTHEVGGDESAKGRWIYTSGVIKDANFPGTKHHLPFLPIWRGLLIDTAFWGGVWFVLLWPTGLVAGKLKRARRRKRGKCAWCKYDLRGIEGGVCPECGRSEKAAGKSSPQEHT